MCIFILRGNTGNTRPGGSRSVADNVFPCTGTVIGILWKAARGVGVQSHKEEALAASHSNYVLLNPCFVFFHHDALSGAWPALTSPSYPWSDTDSTPRHRPILCEARRDSVRKTKETPH